MFKRADLDTPIAQVMRGDCTRLALGATVGETLEALRRNPPGERIVYFYVVDGEGRLAGVVPTRQLLLSSEQRRVDEIMVPRVLALPVTATVRDACDLFALHRFLAIPVVDEGRHLLGVVDIELYTDELDQLGDAEKLYDLFQAIGVYAEAAATTSSLGAFRRRFPWLTSNLIGGLVCAVLANVYRGELARVVALSLFIPVVLNLAESVSSQSVSLTLHALHGKSPGWRAILQTLRRELGTGLLLGTACGILVGGVAMAWLGLARVAICLGAGISFGVAVSALLGATLPVALRRLRLDPKVAAGPIALAGADVATLLVYLALARWLLTGSA
jgi:magnesium transporter